MIRVTTIAVAVLLAGCLGASNDGDDVTGGPSTGSSDWAIRAIYGDDNPSETDSMVTHDHSDRAIHKNRSTSNFELVGWDPLTTDYHGASAGGYYCGEVSKTGDRKLAVVNSFSSAVALIVVDVTDPNTPMKLGELVLPNTQIYDSAITDDGEFAILATSPLAPIIHEDGTPVLGAKTYSETPFWRDNCGNVMQGPTDNLPYVSGTLLVDIRNPSVPVIADFVPGPAIGPHSVSSTTIDGSRYVASSITNLVYAVSYFQFFVVETLPVVDQGILDPHSAYTANYVTDDVVSGVSLLNGHVDATVFQHPKTSQVLAALANWDGGLLVVDIGTPVATLLSTFGDSQQAMGASSGSIHSAYPVPQMVDGKFLIVTGQEVGGSFNAEGNRRPTGQMIVVDYTDPTSPSPVARWTMPEYVRWSGNLHFSTHYPTVVDNTLFVATYHGGVWAADMSPSAWPELPTLGVYLPTMDPPGGTVTDTGYAPYVLDVLTLENRNLLIFDGTSGAYIVKFNPNSTVPRLTPWTEDAWL